MSKVSNYIGIMVVGQTYHFESFIRFYYGKVTPEGTELISSATNQGKITTRTTSYTALWPALSQLSFGITVNPDTSPFLATFRMSFEKRNSVIRIGELTSD